MVENIETIRENFQFESTEQYSAFDQMSQEFLIRELMKEIVNITDVNESFVTIDANHSLAEKNLIFVI